MTSLFDVFRAIQADEADHVTAMKACLDPNVALVSPSIERRILTAVAFITTLGVAMDGNDGLGIATGSVTLENVGSDGMLDAATGLSALASQIMGGSVVETTDGVGDATYGSELLEESLSSQKYISSFLGALAAILGLSNVSGDGSGQVTTSESSETEERTLGNYTTRETSDDC